MGVKVDAHLYAVFIVEFGNFFFDVVDLWVDLGGGVLPGPVEVETGQIAAKVAVDDPVDVEHGEDVEIVLLEQILALGHVLLDKMVDDVLDEVGGPGLAGVLPGQDDHFLLVLFDCLVGEDEVGDLVVADRVGDALEFPAEAVSGCYFLESAEGVH